MNVNLRLAAMLCLSLLADASAAGVERRPNIVLIMADDLGYSDLGCYGGEMETPHLDALAADGLRFTQFYNAARCCPTRAALLTGLYPHQAGVGLMEDNLGRPAYQGFLNDRCLTIAEALRPAGYRSFAAGKWNVGYQRPHWPIDRGFERSFGLLRGAADYFDPRVGPRRNIGLFALDDAPFTSFDDKFYATDAFTDYAVRYIDEAAGREPFFLYVAYTAPHSPLQAWPDDIARYRGKFREGWDVLRGRRRRRMIELGLLGSGVQLAPRDVRVPAWSEIDDADFQDLKMAVYAAQVDRMDQGIGRIVAALKRSKVYRDTLILFLSDNGADGESEATTKDIPPGAKASSHIYGRPWAQLSNTPFRGYKHETHEGGIATPLIAHWPEVIAPGGVTHEPGHLIDVMATCLDVAGAEYPTQHDGRAMMPIEGRSLVPIFRTGRRPPHEALCWEHEGNRAVRFGDWKLVGPRGQAWQLFDLKTDRTELHDLAQEHAEKLQELAAVYDAWAARVGVVSWNELHKVNAEK